MPQNLKVKEPQPTLRNLLWLECRGHIILPAQLQEELKTLTFAIRNIANNVNQIAHHSNIVHDLTLADENNLLQHLKQLEDVVQHYTQGRILESQGAEHDH